MRLASALLLILALSGLAADSPVVGKWACTSKDVAGQESSWTLQVKDDGGKLAGSLVGELGEIPLVEPKLTGNMFTFKVVVNENCTAQVELKITGKNFEGKYGCSEANGTLKGTKQN